jgi:hypothetical protein
MAVSGVGLGIAALSAGYGIYSGERASDVAKKNLRRQTQAQNDAKSAAMAEQRKADEAYRTANKAAPDVSSILAFEEQAGGRGVSSTMLSGGVDRKKLKLEGPSLLGE